MGGMKYVQNIKELYYYGDLEVLKRIILEFNVGRYKEKQAIAGNIFTKEDVDVMIEFCNCNTNEIDTKEAFELIIDKYKNDVFNTIKRIVHVNHILDKEGNDEQKPIVVRYAEYFTKKDIIIKAYDLGLELDLISKLTDFSEYQILSIIVKNNIDNYSVE